MGTTNRNNTAPPRCYDAQDRALRIYTRAFGNFHGRGDLNSQCLTYRLFIDGYRPTTAPDAHDATKIENKTTSYPARCVRP